MAEECKFEIRKLSFKDVAPMARIISKIGIREFKGVVSPENIAAFMDGKDGEPHANALESVGVGVLIDAAGILCENFDKAEQDIAEFLASVSGMKKKDVMELSISDSFELVMAVFKSEGFADFFRRAAVLLK